MKTIQLDKKERIIFIACIVLAIATLALRSSLKPKYSYTKSLFGISITIA